MKTELRKPACQLFHLLSDISSVWQLLKEKVKSEFYIVKNFKSGRCLRLYTKVLGMNIFLCIPVSSDL